MKSLREKMSGKGIYFVIVILVALILGWYFLFAANSYETPIKNYLDGISKADSKLMFQALPDFERKELLKEKSYKDYNEDLKEELDDAKEMYGNNVKMTYKVTDKEKIEKDELEKVAKDLSDEYETQVKISEGYILTVDVTTKGSKKEEKDSTKFRVYKINGSWAIVE